MGSLKDHPTVRKSYGNAVGLSSVTDSHMDGSLIEFGGLATQLKGFG